MFLQTSLLYEKICLVPLEVIIEQVCSWNLLQVARNLRTQKDLLKKKNLLGITPWRRSHRTVLQQSFIYLKF